MISHSAPWVKKFACPHMISHEWFPYKFSYLLMKKWVSHVLIWVLRAWFLIPHHEQRNLHVLIWFLIHDFHMSFSYSLMKICFSYPHMSSHAMRTHWEMRCFRAHRELIWELIMRSMRPFLYGSSSRLAVSLDYSTAFIRFSFYVYYPFFRIESSYLVNMCLAVVVFSIPLLLFSSCVCPLWSETDSRYYLGMQPLYVQYKSSISFIESSSLSLFFIPLNAWNPPKSVSIRDQSANETNIIILHVLL